MAYLSLCYAMHFIAVHFIHNKSYQSAHIGICPNHIPPCQVHQKQLRTNEDCLIISPCEASLFHPSISLDMNAADIPFDVNIATFTMSNILKIKSTSIIKMPDSSTYLIFHQKSFQRSDNITILPFWEVNLLKSIRQDHVA